MSTLVLVIKSGRSLASLQDKVAKGATAPKEQIRALQSYINGVVGGADEAYVDVYTASADPVAASGTITLASVSADDTVTIGKTTLTAKASPSGEDQFSQAGTDTQDAASLVAKINAHSVLSLIVTAANVAGVVTVTANSKGILGNHIALSSSNGTRLAVSGSGYLASGAGGVSGAPTSFSYGLA